MIDLSSIAKNIFSADSNIVQSSRLRPDEVIKGTRLLLDILLPGRLSEIENYSEAEVENKINSAYAIFLKQFSLLLEASNAEELADNLFKDLPFIKEASLKDIHAAFLGDPAAKDHNEVLLSYPGLLAITAHRIAHTVYALKVPYIPRIINEWAHSKTGIDIHPGANIEAGLFIDHGTGVVIGETSKIGKNVKIYQGVTLGAKSFELDENGNPVKGVQRHPTVEDDVVIYANATILGGRTVIGKGSVIGGNVFITKSVEAGSKVVV